MKRRFATNLGNRALVSVQDPIQIGRRSEPQPVLHCSNRVQNAIPTGIRPRTICC